MSGDNAANTAKVQGFALCLPTKRTGRPRTSPIMLLPCNEIARSKALATAPTSKPYPCSPLFPLHRTQGHEKAAMRTAREPIRTAAERKDCPKGWAWEIIFEFLQVRNDLRMYDHLLYMLYNIQITKNYGSQDTSIFYNPSVQ